MTESWEEQVTWSDLGLWSGKMSPEVSRPMKEEISKQSLRKSSGSQSRKVPMCLCLKGSGATQAACTMNWEDGALLGAYTMHSFGESPREENESHLSQILEDSAPQRYSLSAKACLGILNRAKKRGKELPKPLRIALERQSVSKNEQENRGGAEEAILQTATVTSNGKQEKSASNGHSVVKWTDPDKWWEWYMSH